MRQTRNHSIRSTSIQLQVDEILIFFNLKINGIIKCTRELNIIIRIYSNFNVIF
jgi:hypothetical protein